MRRAMPICIAAASRSLTASAILATTILKNWTRSACKPCSPWPMPDRPSSELDAPFLPYGRQEIGDADIKAVVEALCSGWLTTGPRVGQFEKAFARFCGAAEGVAVNSGTAALHA